MGKIDIARKFAEHYHSGQKYGGEHDYMFHLYDCVNTALSWGYNDTDILISLFLHDSLEDTDISEDEIRTNFGDRVLNTVIAVSGVGANRKERMQSIYNKLHMSDIAGLVKLIDRYCNYKNTKEGTSLRKMYAKEMDEFISNLNDFASKVDMDRLINLYK